MTQEPLRIIPLGGLGEIGKNMLVYEYDGQMLIVDCGLMFPESDMPGIDYLIPDMSYLRDKVERVTGIVITHGHEDHLGAINHLVEIVQAPIYATPLTRGLLEVKLARSGASSRADLRTVKAGDMVPVGPFNVEFFHMSHSIPDGVGLGIGTPAGLIVHSSDFKFDQTPVDNWPSDFAKLAEFSRRGVLALLADSTNATETGWTPSERVIDGAFEQVFSQAKGRVIIASFASLISRMQQVANAAARHGRKLAFAGASMVENAKMARKLGYLEIPEPLIVSLEQALNMKDRDIALMVTGAQGEPTSILGRLSSGRYHIFDIKSGDTVVLSSQVIPGNEEDVYRTINRLVQLGADVIYEELAPVHVSGHGSQEDIKLLINLVRPKYYIPIHGEPRHLKQNMHLAEMVGIPHENIALVENGQVIEFREGAMRLKERVANTYIFVDGSGVGEIGPDVMREREVLGRDGIVLVFVVLGKDSGKLLTEPVVTSYGCMTAQDSEVMMGQLRRQVIEVVSKPADNLQKAIETAVRLAIYSETHRRPRIFATVSLV